MQAGVAGVKKWTSQLKTRCVKKFFDDHFIIWHLTIDESKDKKHLENPGVYQFREKFAGANQGLPSWLIFNSKGQLLADSQIRLFQTRQLKRLVLARFLSLTLPGLFSC